MPWWLSLLNPLNWFRLGSLINTIIGLFKSAYDMVQKWTLDKTLNKINQASQNVDQVKHDHPDDLKAQADAMCELEKATNPNADCGK